ncbi:MAG: BON domain-containing protein, partial [Pseudomonadota bacterium]
MGLFDFVKEAGEFLGLGGDDAPEADAVKDAVKKAGLDNSTIDITMDGDKAIVTGSAASQEELEKLILAIGNNKGVAQVESNIEVASASPEAKFVTVKRGDTLSAIAKDQYGAASKYHA